MKRAICLVLSIIMLVTLITACGSKTEDIKQDTETSNMQQNQEETKKEEQKKEVTLHIIHWNLLGKNVIDKFEKENPGIKIQFEQFPVDKFIQVIKTRIASNELPDILGAQEVDFKNYIKQGIYMDLTNENFLANYLDNVVAELKNFSGDGKVYSVPTNAFSLGIWINKDLFKENGVSIPTNYDELVKAAEDLKAKSIPPFVQGIKDGWPIQQGMYTMFEVQVQNEGVYEKCKTGEQKWTDSPIKDGFVKWGEFFGKKGIFIEGSMGLTYEQAYQTFEQGKAAMWPMGSWATEFMKDKDGNPKKLPFEVDFIPIYSVDSKGEKVIPGTYIGAMYSIAAATKNPAEAKKFFEFLTTPENAAEYAKGNGVIFPVKGIDLEAAIPYGSIVGNTTLENKLVQPFNMTVDAAIESQLTIALQNIVAGKSVEEELAEMQKVQEKANQERK